MIAELFYSPISLMLRVVVFLHAPDVDLSMWLHVLPNPIAAAAVIAAKNEDPEMQELELEATTDTHTNIEPLTKQ